ncbi:hypothetical protein AMJ86_00655 [bacterium SM23_57]|nr:MAG: hypothetical protein AMJ86_00655 [bacterium SM23_57]
MANPNPDTSGLKPIKKGEIRNPTGRPAGMKGLTKRLRELVDSEGYLTIENIQETDENGNPTGRVFKIGRILLPKLDVVILAAIKKAVGGDIRATEFIFDRIEGKPKQQISAIHQFAQPQIVVQDSEDAELVQDIIDEEAKIQISGEIDTADDSDI